MNYLPIQLSIASTLAAGMGFIAYQSIHPRGRLWGPIHSRGDRNTGRYALTFDDGPIAGATEAILDTLKELSAPATFFVIGRHVRQRPDLVRRMVEEGHLVANHSYDHWHYGSMRLGRYWDRQIADTARAIEETVGKTPAMFRPPFGVKTPYVNAAAYRAKQAVVTWSRRGMDGVPATTADRILQRLVPTVIGGDVVMLHDGVDPCKPRDTKPSVECVGPLIRQLRDRGLAPAPLNELLGIPAYQADR